MTSYIVAKRYAKALLEIGREDGKLEQYGRELGQVAQVFDQAPELEAVLKNPAFDFGSRAKVLQSVLGKLQLSPIVTNFFRLLMDRQRIDAVRDIAGVYQRLTDEERGITRAQVTSATALGASELEQLKAALRKLAGREVEIEVKEDPSLIGGVVAQIGDLVLDGSVRTQLASLQDSLTRGDYA